MKASTLAVTCLLLVATGGDAWSQTYQGGLRGAVRDANGILAGAEVALVNEQTNATRSTLVNGAGEYAFANVLPGTYTVRASLTGFKTFDASGLRIGTQDFLTLDLRLDVGEVRESVTVTGRTPILETANASVGTMLDRSTLEMLPNAARNVFVLSWTTRNVIPSGAPQFVRQQDQNANSSLSLAGGPRRGSNFLLDGVPITDIFNRAAIIPSIEAVEEVKVQVSVYDAEMGRTGGGVFNTTHKSGSNLWHGSGLYLDRPQWGTAKLFFTRESGAPKPETFYHLWGGSLGGPIARNRTFFWASTEGYRTQTSSSTVLTLPTERERRGDYSQSLDLQGRLIVIYDPLTTRPDPNRPGQYIRDAFPGNIIPPGRLNPVALNLVKLLPLPTTDRSAPRTAAPIADLTNQATVKIDHRLSNRHTISGTYAWYHSREPASQYYGGVQGDPGAAFSPRTVNTLALNDVLIPGDRSVLAFRYGFTRFRDDYASAPSDANTLGFSPGFTSAIRGFPAVTTEGYGVFGTLFDGGALTESSLYSHSANVSFSELLGRHTVKVGGDYRRIGMQVFAPAAENGTFNFTRGFTQGPNPNVAGTTAGDAIASLLIGLPASGSFNIATPNDLFTNYYSAYIQDDVRMRSNLTVNLGVRYEFEQGLTERNDAFTVGFDRDRPFPIQVPGFNLQGGLMYAGADGYSTYQGDPSSAKFGPRAGIAWSLDSRTVIRGGYGLFWAPTQMSLGLNQGALGTRGFTGVTTYLASVNGGLTPCAGCSLTDPFPGGLEKPQGSALGPLTGAGGDVDFVDQFSQSAYVHQYSIDLQRELPGKIAASIGYLGSRSERLGVGGTSDSRVNINQLDPAYQSFGAALQASVPNPFFGIPGFGDLTTQPTIERGQLLRPYPQFKNVFAHRVSAARARYNALVLNGERRQHNGWGMRVNYTFSARKDNQFGEGNFFSPNPSGAALDNYDLDREFGYSLLDTPHRLNISGTIELPFGEGKRWLSGKSPLTLILGGWAFSAIGMYQSGFPVVGGQANNNSLGSAAFGSGQRPNIVPGVEPSIISGRPEDNYDPACACIRWLNPAAWSLAAPFTFGDAPRTETRVRTPSQRNWDLALQKTHPVGGKRVTVRAEWINVFDNPAFGGPRPGFGRVDFGQITTVGGFARTLQLTVRLAW